MTRSGLLKTADLTFSYSGRNGSAFSLAPVNISVESGEFVSVIGRNGSGKSTLVKILANQLIGYEGIVILKDKPVSQYSSKEIARELAYLPQSVSLINESVTVKDLALLGRFPHKKAFEFGYDKCDRAAVDESLTRLNLLDFADKHFGDLSGGQKQKALLSVALSQLDIASGISGKLLIVDEPLTFLDVNHQYEVFNLLRELNTSGLTVIAVVHDLNIALRYSSRCLLMSNGETVKFGPAPSVITEEMLREHFLIESRIMEYEKNYFINYLA